MRNASSFTARSVAFSVAASVAVALAGCGKGDGAGTDGGSATDGPSGFSDTDATFQPGGACNGSPPRFADIYRDILEPNYCTSPNCHGQATAAGGLDMHSAEYAYIQLLDQKPTDPQCSIPARVVVGKPDDSLLYMKVVPKVNTCGDKMPADKGGLTADEAQKIGCWIYRGALK